jgi:hypothetical protein
MWLFVHSNHEPKRPKVAWTFANVRNESSTSNPNPHMTFRLFGELFREQPSAMKFLTCPRLVSLTDLLISTTSSPFLQECHDLTSPASDPVKLQLTRARTSQPRPPRPRYIDGFKLQHRTHPRSSTVMPLANHTIHTIAFHPIPEWDTSREPHRPSIPPPVIDASILQPESAGLGFRVSRRPLASRFHAVVIRPATTHHSLTHNLTHLGSPIPITLTHSPCTSQPGRLDANGRNHYRTKTQTPSSHIKAIE